MPDVLETDLAPLDGSGIDPSVVPRGMSIPFHVESFGISSYNTPSIPLVEVPSHTHPRPSTSVPIQGLEPRNVNIGGTSYIPSHIPLSSTPIPSNYFLTTHPPPNSTGPSGRSSTTSHVLPTSANTIVS